MIINANSHPDPPPVKNRVLVSDDLRIKRRENKFPTHRYRNRLVHIILHNVAVLKVSLDSR